MIFVSTGAGISAESGMRTYRGDLGLWEGHRIVDVATPEGLARDRDAVNAFYDARQADNLAAAPNPAHLALARLEREIDEPVIIVTQNIDTLHERAGSARVIHIHGQLGRSRCIACNHVTAPQPLLVGAPDCGICGGAQRPDIVFFGEQPDHMEEVAQLLRQCRLFIAVGTSGVVWPAAGFVRKARKRKARTIEINPMRSDISGYFHEHIRGPAGIELPMLVDRVLRETCELANVRG